MRAIIENSHGGPEALTISEVPAPVPRFHEVLIRVHAAGINRADALQRRGFSPPPAGVTVGMDASILQELYGTGAVDPTKHKARRMPGYDYYTYWQAGNPLHYLTFGVKDGKIAFIKVGLMQR